MKNKITALALGAVLSLQGICFSPVSAYAEDNVSLPDNSETLMMDLNDDGIFNVADVVKLQQHISRKITIDSDRLKRADMNGDGKVNVFDLIIMKRKLAEEISAPPGDEEVPAERPLLTLESYDEYEKYIADNSLEGKFVSYDDIKYIGDFKSFVVLSDYRLNDYSEVMYGLEDNAGASLSLCVTNLENIENDNTASAEKQIPPYGIYWNDMRITNGPGISGIFTYDGKTYRYVDRKLASVSWTDDSYEYRLMCEGSMLYNYPNIRHTLEPLPLGTYTTGLLGIDHDFVEIDLPLMTFDTVDEYTEYISDNFLKYKVMTYDDIRCAGEFKSAAVLSNDWSELVYTLDDGSGHEINFCVKKRVKDESDTLQKISEGEIDLSDMRKIKSGDANGFIDIGNRRYTYIDGELLSVSWDHITYNCTITGNSMLNDYPIDSDTFTSCMLKIVDSPYETTAELPFMSFDTSEGYRKYIEENSLSEEIITVKDLYYMGAYYLSCTFLSKDGSEMIYGVDGDGGNSDFYLALRKTDGNETDIITDIPESEIDLSDMRTTKSRDISGSYVCNGRTYKYIRGTLISVSWLYDGYKCTLTGGLMFKDYKLKSHTYVSSCILKINNSPDAPVDLYTITFESFKGYKQYVAENALRGRVVTYDDFSYIGEFKSAVVTSGDWSRVLYALNDGSGHRVELYTYCPKRDETSTKPEIPESEINFYDMRKPKSEGLIGVFEYDGRKYNYVKNGLLSISWTENDCEYVLNGGSALFDYPIEADTFTAGLLKINDQQ